MEQNQSFILLEAGSEIAHNIRIWGHVTLFSPWRYNINKGAKALLEETDWEEPDLETLPSGHELIDLYLKPLAELALIKPFIHLNSKVVGVSRVRAHGEEILRQPEKGFYIVGAKSYGRAPTFLMATGFEQVRSITAYLAGDEEASQRSI